MPDFYTVASYQSGTTWVNSEDGLVKLHMGYWGGKPPHPESVMMGRGLMEKSRLATSLCKCLNDAHEFLHGEEAVKPHIWGLTTFQSVIIGHTLRLRDAYLGDNCSCNYQIGGENGNAAWNPRAFPDYFIEEMTFIMEEIKANSKDA